MIFAIGLILVVVGFVGTRATAPPLPFMEHQRAFYAAAMTFLVGGVLIVISLVLLAWRYLP